MLNDVEVVGFVLRRRDGVTPKSAQAAACHVSSQLTNGNGRKVMRHYHSTPLFYYLASKNLTLNQPVDVGGGR